MSEKKSVKYILFTHNDLDGAGCRVMYELAYHGIDPATWKVINCANGTVDDEVQKILDANILDDKATITFADICCGREMLQTLLDLYDRRIFIFDHHRTNFWAQTEYAGAVILPENALGVQQAGTNLIYQAFCNMAMNPREDKPRLRIFEPDFPTSNLLAEFSDTVRSYDTYEWKDTGNIKAKQLQTLFLLLGMERFCARYVKMLSAEVDISPSLITDTDMEFVSAKLDAEQTRIDAFTPNDCYIFELRGHKTAFTLSTVGMNVSELGYQFLRKYPEFDIFVSFTTANGGEFSFRTAKEDLNLGEEIAKPIGGGGHPKAAGAKICEELRDLIAEYLMAEMEGKSLI